MTDCSRPGACSEDGPGVARNGTYRRTLVTQCAFKQKSAQALRIFLYGTVISGFMMCTRNRTCTPLNYSRHATHVYSSQSGLSCAQPYGDFDIVCHWIGSECRRWRRHCPPYQFTSRDQGCCEKL